MKKNLLDGKDIWTIGHFGGIRFDQLSEAKLFAAITQDKRKNALFIGCRFYKLH